MVKKLKISAGHGEKVSGANGFIKEHDEADKVTAGVAKYLKANYVCDVETFDEKTATTQNGNLYNIDAWHDRTHSDLNLFVHFNAASATATGTEAFGMSTAGIKYAKQFSKAMAKALGVKDRGGMYKNLYVLRNTKALGVLLEVVFVTNKKDVEKYKKEFDDLCAAIGDVAAYILGYKRKKAEMKKVSGGIVTKEKINYYDGPRWNKPTGQKGGGSKHEVVGIVEVDGYPMYKTKSGNYMTAADKFVTYYDAAQWKNVCK